MKKIRRIKRCQQFQVVGCHQGKDVWSKGEVVPLVQPLVPHVDCSEVLDVVASPWLDVVHGGCHHCVQVLIGDEGTKEEQREILVLSRAGDIFEKLKLAL